ncbi:MAG: sigma factor, ECF subfamily protein [Verrucomicrobiales bacterium]|nr:sigma factor, ECF subfamily protein [Verrucomicrobiales bacterium]
MSAVLDDAEKPTGDVAGVAGVSEVVEHLFRHEAGRMVAILTRIFGIEHLGLAEDVVQETLARALRTWPYYGVPSNPPAWILRAARNLALDVVRREKVFRDKESEIIQLMEGRSGGADEGATGAGDFNDDRLRLMFVCCHPRIPPEAQAALALKTLCGFSEREISRAFLTSEAAVAKRLTRAKQRIREAGIVFEIPEGEALKERLDGVLRALYLLFNEGYKASVGDELVRDDICREAIRLVGLLAQHPVGNVPRTHALLALMLLTTARSASRVDGDGNLLRLRDQNRALWDRSMIARGMFHLAQSASGSEVSEYHLQAGIAACHCSASSYEATDWERVLQLYDRWVAMDGSPVVALNRAVVVANVQGPEAGMQAVEAIQGRQKLEGYYLLYAVLGELEARTEDALAAAGYFRKAMQLADLRSEQEFLARRFRECERQIEASH